MTHAQRNAAILKRISAYTTANTASKKAAQKALVNEGFYLNRNDASPEFADDGERKTAHA